MSVIHPSAVVALVFFFCLQLGQSLAGLGASMFNWSAIGNCTCLACVSCINCYAVSDGVSVGKV